MRRDLPALVIDTNVFVAALFKPSSDSARILSAIRQGSARMLWNDETRRETRAILEKIPPLSWDAVAGLFLDEERCVAETDPERFTQIPDPDDRKFAGLAHAAGAILISLDDDLLGRPHKIDLLVLTPSEFLGGQWAIA
ncbi:MAG: putative toxin-antitoxin system toxin component, PIN family [Candidatus Bipolaricaulia bacterium]